MPSPLSDVARRWLAQSRPAVLIEVSAAQGSVPRGAGTRMLVAADRCDGTIGGGHLELKAIDEARALLSTFGREGTAAATTTAAAPAGAPLTRHYPLGPALGQCCGGAVTLRFEFLTAAHLDTWPAARPRFHLQLYGAGHVGRAIARLLATLPVRVDWIDARDGEFPAALLPDGGGWPAHIRRIVVDDDRDVAAEVAGAPPGAFFLVLTHRHDLDLAITEAILRRGDFGFLGLIGSRTKRQRFIHRFQALGIAPAAIARMTCPIGIAGIDGKEPEVIAVAVVAQLLRQATAPPPAQHRPGRLTGKLDDGFFDPLPDAERDAWEGR